MSDEKEFHPLDHDKDGRPGGSLPKDLRTKLVNDGKPAAKDAAKDGTKVDTKDTKDAVKDSDGGKSGIPGPKTAPKVNVVESAKKEEVKIDGQSGVTKQTLAEMDAGRRRLAERAGAAPAKK